MAQTTINPNNSNLQYSGRIDFSNTSKPRFYYGGCSVTTKFSGTSLKAVLTDENWGGDNYVGFIIDDGTEITKSVPKNAASQTITVATGLSNTTHKLIMFKRASLVEGYLGFEGFILDSGAIVSAPDAKPTRKIELYGDSVTEGVNAANTVDQEGGLPKASAWDSFGNVLARKLNAQVYNNGISGLAVKNGTGWFNYNATGSGGQADAIGLESTYKRLATNTGRISDWNFSNYTPHLVIMAMGINDNASVTSSNKEAWKTLYKSVINDLRNNKYPDADFILTVPPLGQQYDNIATYLSEIVREINDPDVHYFDITVAAPSKHPYKDVHAQIANQLYDFVNTLDINWGVNVPVTGVSVSPTTASVAVNSTQQLTVTVNPTSATNKTVTWSSSDTTKATVSATGLVTGVAVGSATITVKTADGNKTATCVVTVTAAAATEKCGLISNFGFQTGNFSNWDNASRFASITSDAKTGSKAAVLNGKGGLNYSTNIKVTANYKLTYEVWAKVTDNPTNAQIGIDYIDESGVKLGNDVFRINTNSYTKYSLSKVPPIGTVKVLIWSYKGSESGKMYMDDFCLKQTNACKLFINYGFETDFSLWDNANGVASIGTASQSKSGNKCAVLNNSGGLNRSVKIAVSDTKKINYEVYAKVENNPTNAQVGIDYLDASGTKLGNDFFAINSTDYKLYSISKTPPSGTKQVLAWTFKASSGGKMYIDDFCLSNDVSIASKDSDNTEEEGRSSLFVYPNPVKDKLRITALESSTQKMNVLVMDFMGKNVITKDFDSVQGVDYVEVDLQNILPGSYLVKAIQGSKQKTSKIIKEN